MEEKLKPIEALIVKYSLPPSKVEMINCPLCLKYYNVFCSGIDFNKRCVDCPNYFFEGAIGCAYRARKYPHLDYSVGNNYPTLKKFWSDYKILFLEGKSNEEIMEILIKVSRI